MESEKACLENYVVSVEVEADERQATDARLIIE
jgi:hypothetical protein